MHACRSTLEDPTSTASADFNGDGLLDLAVVTFTDGTLMVFAGDGAGALAAPATFAAGAGARTLVASDLDDDGRVDLVAALRDESLAAWFMNDGPFADEDEPALPPTAVAGADKSMECSSADGALVRLDGSESSADDGVVARFEWLLANGELLAEGALVDVVLPLGASTITLRVTDAAGETATDSVLVVVEDTTAPSLSLALDPDVLWPPDHRMVAVGASVDASDACGAVSMQLVAVTSSQPDDANGGGDGKTKNDIQGASLGSADYDFLLRAEREASDWAGRSYDVTYRATDASGNVSEATRSVHVPHSHVGDDDGHDGDDDDDDDDDRGRGRGRGHSLGHDDGDDDDDDGE